MINNEYNSEVTFDDSLRHSGLIGPIVVAKNGALSSEGCFSFFLSIEEH